MKNIKKYIIGIAASICLTQCDVLDVDPTGWYSENVAYSSLENVDLYVKGLYSVLYDGRWSYRSVKILLVWSERRCHE